MKSIIIAALTVFSATAFAQGQSPDTFCIATCRMTINTEIDASGYISVQIPRITLQDAQQDWLTYIGYGSVRQATAVNGESLHAGMINKVISPEPFNLSSRLVETSGGIRLTVWFTEPDMLRARQVQNINSNQALQKYVLDFATLEYKRAVQDELKFSQERQKDLQAELSMLMSDEARLVKTTNENQAHIKCANETIAIYCSGIQKLTDQIDFRKSIIKNTASETKTGIGSQMEIGRLQDERKNLSTANDQMRKEINLWDKEIKVEAKCIVQSKERQLANSPDTNRQKLYVEAVQAEINSIK
jgi:hypothetical protein